MRDIKKTSCDCAPRHLARIADFPSLTQSCSTHTHKPAQPKQTSYTSCTPNCETIYVMLSSKFGVLRALAAQSVTAPSRNFTVSAVAFAQRGKTDSEKKKAAKQAEKAKQAKLKEKEKAFKQKALKPLRSLSGHHVYIKEKTNPSKKLSDVAAEWKTLSEGEKEGYKRRADEINQKRAQIYPPKPKRPMPGFASYLKEKYYDGESLAVVLKELSNRWNQLTAAEKAEWSPEKSAVEKFKTELEAWTEKRLKAARDHGLP